MQAEWICSNITGRKQSANNLDKWKCGVLWSGITGHNYG